MSAGLCNRMLRAPYLQYCLLAQPCKRQIIVSVSGRELGRYGHLHIIALGMSGCRVRRLHCAIQSVSHCKKLIASEGT